MVTNKEKMAILAKATLTIKDIQNITGYGQQKVTVIVKDFKEWFSQKYKQELYRGHIPTGDFVKWARIDEKRIKEYAELGY